VIGAGEGTFRGVGDVPLYWKRVVPPTGVPRAVVCLVHGYAEHLGRYGELMTHLTARRLAVAAVDLRGHGRSGGPRGHCRDFAEMVSDVHALVAAAREWWPATPRVLFGHSMGGLVAALYLLHHSDTVRGAVLCAPALRVPASGPPVLLGLARLLGRVLPRLSFRSTLDAGALSREPSVGHAYVSDPLVHRKATAGFVRAIAAAQAAVLRDAAELRTPILLLQGDADRLVEPAGARELKAKLTCPGELVEFAGYYHELLNEPVAFRERVLSVVDGWIDRLLAP
jgi:alpha-beta hydrolase superfamily lysophospholipase